MVLLPPTSTLFPYTTLFRSERLIIEHLPQVRLIARKIHERLPETVALDESSGRSDRSEETRLNSSHSQNSYAVFCLKKKNTSDRFRGSCKHFSIPRRRGSIA